MFLDMENIPDNFLISFVDLRHGKSSRGFVVFRHSRIAFDTTVHTISQPSYCA